MKKVVNQQKKGTFNEYNHWNVSDKNSLKNICVEIAEELNYTL